MDNSMMATGTSFLKTTMICCATLFATSVSAADWQGKTSSWKGYQRFDFQLDDRDCFVVVPEQAAAGNPWVWRARFPNYHADADVLLLGRGFHIAHIDTAGMLGSPRALDHWDVFYETMTGEHGLSAKVALEAVSRGGLFAYRWAARHPDRVACIYADTPVCDFKSWPLGQGTGVGSDSVWNSLLEQYTLTHEQALAFRENPIDILAPIARAKVPLLHIVSLNDLVVPPKENTFVLAKRYRELGGSIEIIEVKAGSSKSQGHHFEHPDPKRVADFIENQCID
jgi:pimeloyl-ACP methyl ester carboxylesterase